MPIDSKILQLLQKLDTSAYENTPIPELGGLTLVQLRDTLGKFQGLLKGLRDLFPFLLKRYTSDERQTKSAKASLREDELEAVMATYDAADTKPDALVDLAGADEGTNSEVLETNLLRARVVAYTMIFPLSEQLVELASDIRDTAVESGFLGKFLVSEIYGILKFLSSRNATLRTLLAKATDYRRSIAPRREAPAF